MNYLCIHCHFYQPPRENPWLEEIELQDSAYPYHDWNERITAECYAPNLAARILDEDKCIAQILNNYTHLSFNFGPTFLSWAAMNEPETYRGILEADKISQKRFSGHGSAIAQAYNHMILPLSNTRDKRTQIRWGIDDFASRFGRMPEGMWLAETAVDIESLDLMAEAGIKYTVLAPRQAKALRKIGAKDWSDVTGSKIDPTRAYQCSLPSGRSIVLFFYDGPVSQAVAFEKLLDNGEKFAHRLLGALDPNRPWTQLMHIATDGETYGHHHRYGEMALAYALQYIENNNLAKLTNYGEFLSLFPPTHEVQIYENTAWSCVHGVERWCSDCGCNSGGRPGWNQRWRRPLREALDHLRDVVNPLFEQEAAKYLRDPWASRDAYIAVVLDRSEEAKAEFARKYFRRPLNDAEQVTVWKLMEMQRHAMLMYTSCGWFFDDLSGIETVQVIQYAGRVVQLAEQIFSKPFEARFLEELTLAHSNMSDQGDGAAIYRRYVKPAIVDLEKVGAHYAITSLFEPASDKTDIYAYGVDLVDYHSRDAGRLRMAIGQARLTSKITSEAETLTFWVVHFGDHNVAGGVRRSRSEQDYLALLDSITDSFSRVEIPEVIRLLDRDFGDKTYSLRSLFRDEQRRILNKILTATVGEAEAAYLQLYEHHASLMRFIMSLGTPLPAEFRTAMEYAINSHLRTLLSSDQLDTIRIKGLLQEAKNNEVKLDATTLEFTLRRKIEEITQEVMDDPHSTDRLKILEHALQVGKIMPFPMVLWAVQNRIYELAVQMYESMALQREEDSGHATTWCGHVEKIAQLLSLRLTPAVVSS